MSSLRGTSMGKSRTQVFTPPTPAVPAEPDLRPPPVRAGFVTRSGLVETLRASEADVITLIAPTGYGKTTTLAQWARAETAPTAWLTLRREHNGAKSLFTHLAAAMRQAGIMKAEDVAVFQFMSELTVTTEGARHFAGRLESMREKATVVMDEANVLRSRTALDALTELVRQLEGRVRFAFASHATPKIRLPTVRSRGGLLEITEEHLVFSPEEVEQLVTRLGLDATAAAEIFEMTEGWPAAAFITAVAERDARHDPARRRIEGQRHLHEFVRSEIVPHLSRQRRRFLTVTSLLDRMSGPLCDAVTGADSSQRLLESLDRETHLVHHLDHDDEWFVTNRVLRETLRADMERKEPETARAVHSAAATWYEAQGMLVEGIDHARLAGEADALTRLMGRLIKDRYTTGHLAEVLSWMTWLEENVALEDHPNLAAIGALVHMQEGDVLATERWLEAASRRALEGDSRAVVSLVRASGTRAGVDQMIRDIEEAASAAGPGSRWLPAILVIRGLANVMSGDIRSAEAAFIEAAKAGSENQSRGSVVMALGQRALIAIERQDWDLAGHLSDEAVAIIDEFGLDGYLASGPPLIAAARCARHDNDIPAAQRLLSRAARVRPRLGVTIPGEAVLILLEMARAHAELSDVKGARPLIKEAEEIILQRPDLGVLPAQVAAAEEALAGLAPGKIALPALTKAELRVLPLLATHMSFPEIGEQLFVSRHTIKSQATSIYRKLGSSNRSEAIAKAREIGLLGQ